MLAWATLILILKEGNPDIDPQSQDFMSIGMSMDI